MSAADLLQQLGGAARLRDLTAEEIMGAVGSQELEQIGLEAVRATTVPAFVGIGVMEAAAASAYACLARLEVETGKPTKEIAEAVCLMVATIRHLAIEESER